MVLEYSHRVHFVRIGIAGEGSPRSMSSIKPTEAHRRHLVQGNEKKERTRTYPFAGDTDNDATYDPEEEAEEAPAAGPSLSRLICAKSIGFVVVYHSANCP